MGSLREYETVFVLHPGLEEARIEEEIEGVRSVIAAASGEILDVERWGRRKLAYTIGKVNEGIYTLVRFRSEAGVVNDLERRYRLREDIMRHLTVLSQGPPPAEMGMHREDSGLHVVGAPQEAAAPSIEGGEAVPGTAPVTMTDAAEPAPVTTTDAAETAPAESETKADNQAF